MSEPSPALLRECADQLRDLARKHRTSAAQASGLVDGCADLGGTQTWAGTYAEQTDASISAWKRGLHDDAGTMRGDASAWEHAAEEFDDKAAAAEKSEREAAEKEAAAKKAKHK